MRPFGVAGGGEAHLVAGSTRGRARNACASALWPAPPSRGSFTPAMCLRNTAEIHGRTHTHTHAHALHSPPTSPLSERLEVAWWMWGRGATRTASPPPAAAAAAAAATAAVAAYPCWASALALYTSSARGAAGAGDMVSMPWCPHPLQACGSQERPMCLWHMLERRVGVLVMAPGKVRVERYSTPV